MASKKEHRRREKRKQRAAQPAEPAGAAAAEERPASRFGRVDELNSLSLAEVIPAAPKAPDAETAPEAAETVAENGGEGEGIILTVMPDDSGPEETEQERAEAQAAVAALKEAEAAERARVEAMTAERLRRQAEELAARRAAEEAEKAEAVERRRREAEEAAAERARKMAEEAEAARRIAEQVAQVRRDAEQQEAREAQARRERDAEARARHMAEAAERVRRMTERVEAARREAEAAERALLSAREQAVREEQAAGESAAPECEPDVPTAEPPPPAPESAPAPAVSAAPPLEVDNPYWEQSSPVFAMMSGSPHGAPPEEMAEDAAAAGMLPASLAGEETSYERGEYVPDESIAEKRLPDEDTRPVPVEKRMYIVMVTPEVAPCAKVGGLGDVILGLGRELMKRGHGVEVICPMYSSMRYDQISDLHEEYGELWCPHYNEWRAEKVFKGTVEGGLQVNFITGGAYTERDAIYGYADDLERFTYFSRAALEFMYKSNRRPDIIHCHDWATGLVPVAYWDIYSKLGWDNSRFVYTIHNNECQGLCGFSEKLLGLIGLNFREFHRPDRLQDDSHANCINMMKGGIVYSNFVTTVSPTYAGELKTVAGGRGLQNTIARHSAKVGGVLNGIDYDSWNPRTDSKLAARYSESDDFFEKYHNKKALREWLGLYDAWKPIVSVVTRLTHQKGLDLIKHAIFATLERDGQFVLLGSAPDPKVNADFLALQHQLRDNHDCNLYIGYHEDLSRLIYAGSDMFLVPSLYEPCGLTQMISLRYGTVPIVRETGGLVDTVFDLDNSGRGLSEANGFTFRDPTPESLDYGLNRAIRLWYDNPEGFNRLARNGMHYDYSWRHPAEHYENIYNYIKA